MGAPAPQTPAYIAYCVHFLSRTGSDCSETLLSGIKVSTRCFAKPDENFFDATATVLNAGDITGLEHRPKRSGLLLAQSSGAPDSALGEKILWPDLWMVDNPGVKGEADLAAEWIGAGAGAVAVLGRGFVCWESRNGAFGQSQGCYPLQEEKGSLDFFTAGLLLGVMEELLGETLFDKTVAQLDRECLEMRPLRLGRAVQSGMASMAGEGLGKVRDILGEWRGAAPQSWGGRSR